MDLEYENKFEEMKKYIPFLERMINKLESKSTSSKNPRQAQLDKLRSLRDLLLDRRKRMKMENLLKCEQVLINLYAKVEQKDDLPGITPILPSADTSTTIDKPELTAARKKLVKASKPDDSVEESGTGAFEIARACETEVVCTPGSKEPALFQRRPNKNSKSPSRNLQVDIIDLDDESKPSHTVPKRNYTRVLVSPEPDSRRWQSSEDISSKKPLFSRRSPRKSPAYSKKEKIKSPKKDKSKRKDLNITLNVPEESLSSLNTEDIFSRIISCHDSDVDIATLRDLRSQILGELKRTGATDDISDLILKSYKTKKKLNKKEEIEEGELSDSESEAIESVYGSLVLVDKDKKNTIQPKTVVDKDKEKQPRKIQICLVMNPDKQEEESNVKLFPKVTDLTDFEMLDDDVPCVEPHKIQEKQSEPQNKEKQPIKTTNFEMLDVDVLYVEPPKLKENQTESHKKEKQVKDSIKALSTENQEVITIDDEDGVNTCDTNLNEKNEKKVNKNDGIGNKGSDSSCIDVISSDTDTQSPKVSNTDINVEEKLNSNKNRNYATPFKANFYKPLIEQDKEQTEDPKTNKHEITVSPQKISNISTEKPPDPVQNKKNISVDKPIVNTVQNKKDKSPVKVVSNIEFLSDKKEDKTQKDKAEESTELSATKKDVVSEIDILQALKNEILSESIAIPGTEGSTPLLHQPKVTKVSSAKEIAKKNKISIEKYKEKVVSQSKTPLFLNDPTISMALSQNNKKSSLKLTEEECERFNFPNKLSLERSSDEEDNKSEFSVTDVYSDLAPKSPENTEEHEIISRAPIIIPVEQVKPNVVSSNTDVDMRTPKPTPKIPLLGDAPSVSPKLESKKPLLLDPRVRREINNPFNKNSPNPYVINPERTPRTAGTFPNVTPNMTPNSRSFELTPSHQNLDFEDSSGRKHVYAPMPTIETHDRREKSVNIDNCGSRWEHNPESWKNSDVRDGNHSTKWSERDRRDNQDFRDNRDNHKSTYESDKYQKGSRSERYGNDYNRLECPRTPVHQFGRGDLPTTPNPSFGRHDSSMNYSRSDCPTTPIHSFGRSDCPNTPNHPFGRSEVPLTPIHPFGRSDGPQTPSHPFGRSEGPVSSNHSYSRPDQPMTPGHPFGRSDRPMTPSHPFGRSEASMTPSHPFGRSDASMTPSHPFGRSDASMTPSHPFGRSDTPMTPSHPFGHSDAPMTPSHPFGMAPLTPSHPFGRSDFTHGQNSSKVIKDPRLNRSTEYDNRKYKDDRDYHKQRILSDRSEQYQRHGRDNVGVNDRNKYDTSRNFRDRTPGRESSVGRSFERDRFGRGRGANKSRDYHRDSENKTNYHDVRQNQGYQRAQSVGGSGPEEFNRLAHKQTKDNTLSVKPQSGRSFTIDTSVNATFQEFLDGKGLNIFDKTADPRRARAASVGRSLKRESSVGRTFRESSVGRTLSKPQHMQEDTSGYKKMVEFVRARSMCRDLNDRSHKTLKEVKAEFESFSSNFKTKQLFFKKTNKSNYVDSRSIKHLKEIQRNSITPMSSDKKTAYSPRKNYRDPRMRKNQTYEDKKYKNRYQDNRNPYGIVYSNDNLAKGTVLGTGYGVKNYKIPKIKRPVEETQVKEPPLLKKEKDQSNKIKFPENRVAIEKKEKQNSSKLKPDLKKTQDVANKAKIETSKICPKGKTAVGEKPRKTSASEKPSDKEGKKNSKSKNVSVASDILKDEIILKARKLKKAVIDSDSDSEPIEKTKVTDEIPDENPSNKKEGEDILNSSFGLDDLLFPDSITADPVMANINALIADLDNDLKTNKNEDFTKEMLLDDNIFENIDSPEDNLKGITVEESLQDISEMIKEDYKIPNSERNTSEATDKLVENAEIKSSNEIRKPQETDKLVENVEIGSSNEIQKPQETDKPVENVEIGSSNEIQKPQETDKPVENAEIGSSNEIQKPQETDKQIENAEIETSNEQKPQEKEVDTSGNSIKEITTVTFNSSNKRLVDKDASVVTEFNIAEDKLEECKIDVVVSTIRNEDILKVPEKQAEEPCSTPDSTITTSEIIQNKSLEIPDSTDSRSETDVSSTHNQSEPCQDTANSSNTTADSIGNLLSILQNKSKLKELLGMLDGQSSDTEKIKKKLKKLSEIVSDEEETNDTLNQSEFTDKETENKDTEEKTKENYIKSNDNVEPSKSSETSNLDLLTDTKFRDEEKSQEHIVKPIKSRKIIKKRTKKGKFKPIKKKNIAPEKRITRSEAAKPKKPSRELKLLQESLKEMFSSDNILNASGIRMCRLAKMIDDNNPNQDESNSSVADPKPVVVLQKFNEKTIPEEGPKLRKKTGSKPKPKPVSSVESSPIKEKDLKLVTPPKYKPGPKSKTKIFQPDDDPYCFDDSVSEITTTTDQTSIQNSSDSESESLASDKSFGSSEALAELKKKPKRKRRLHWQSGVIKPSKKRKKVESKQADTAAEKEIVQQKPTIVPDTNCFTDKTYCFQKNVDIYPCRLCEFKGLEIVKHFKTNHPHTEIPLSRMSTVVARDAVDQCEDINFHAVSKMHTDRYVCRFCFEEFGGKKNILEQFFWHVVSMHTGEYKRPCSGCSIGTKCTFNLDIPPPPKDVKGQLIGYICGKCNFTQISLENLKTHVIVRHNDEQTAVYTINLAVMTKKTMKALMTKSEIFEQPRVLRSTRLAQNISETSDPGADKSEILNSTESVKTEPRKENSEPQDVPISSKLTFESDVSKNSALKIERVDNTSHAEEPVFENESDGDSNTTPGQTSDILDCSHFKISYGASGNKEYVCCINGKDNHYKTTLLISMKKHVQMKHSEVWDGYCSICKVIVMPQGTHSFKDCLQHLLDKHMDNFPVLEETNTSKLEAHTPNSVENAPETLSPAVENSTPRGAYINVRKLSDLMCKDIAPVDESEALPKIQSVVSLGAIGESQPDNPTLMAEDIVETASKPFKTPGAKPVSKPHELFRYEEVQAEIMSKKHRVILHAMMTPEKLTQIFKCAGRYCSFTTDSVDAAVLHASTHQRFGGEDALICAYCDFDCKANLIDLVMHVFKAHGSCQFACAHCFYRAVSSQQVLTHTNRIHGEDEKVVLQASTVTPVGEDSLDPLPRETAVPHYICQLCRFKTFTQGKFYEHLQKHTPPYNCNICSTTIEKSVDLIVHYKTHGIKMYQCTWCINGGDNEADFLTHSSIAHPNKPPQAYLRIITSNNKDGGSKTMVLPLCKLNNSKVSVKLIPAASSAEDPVKEAERAHDFEKIIISMPVVTSVATTPEISTLPIPISPAVVTPVPQSSPASLITHEMPVPNPDKLTAVEKALSLIDLLNTKQGDPPPILHQNQDVSITPVIKSEPLDKPSTKVSSEVICLDSDEEESRDSTRPMEDSRQNIIDLSDDDPVQPTNTTSCHNEPKRFPLHELFKCHKCKVLFKNHAGFKRHINSCNKRFYCAHCNFKGTNSNALIGHYTAVHETIEKVPYSCGMCDFKDKTVLSVKHHAERYHDCFNFIVTSNSKDGKILNYVVSAGIEVKQPGKSKRKLSSGTGPEIAPKRTRYGPQDLDKLPQKPILDELTYCSECEFSTKVRLNLVRHFQQHAEAQLVPQTAPVNPVPHLESNEKHFDKMINLASSSLVNSKPDKAAPIITVHIPPSSASCYPTYVPERQRYTCGAKGCTYTSVDEAMLKCHWETLHSGCSDFRCVHCPPNQQLDTSKPLSALRIVAHLKMHDVSLFACSICKFYHHKKLFIDKHLIEVHKGAGHVKTVREETTNYPSPLPQPANAAATMDLKPWHCGLCAFTSMLRPEVSEHCSKTHGAKMQFKCPACPYRTSTLENVSKHKSNSHPGNTDDVFYYYYREGSVPDESDGTPRWMKQQQKVGIIEPEVKRESSDNSSSIPVTPILPAVTPAPPKIDLQIVKKEVTDTAWGEESMDDLCERFGAICDPNGLKYKCPLCKLVLEDTREAMQSHLYEELKYRKWGCSICSYKAFHKNGLKEHMFMEHRILRGEPIELPEDSQVEKWVTKVLDHQTSVVNINKNDLTKQKLETESQASTQSTSNSASKPKENPAPLVNEKQFEEAIQQFGQLGAPNNGCFSCPKCEYQDKDENAMKDHLQSELNKIRWCCSSCGQAAQNYHEAQLHTKSCSHAGRAPPRPVEAIRDPSVRAAWLAAVIRTQMLAMDRGTDPTPDDDMLPNSPDNSLLVVRYEEDIPTPEEEMRNNMNRAMRPAASPPAPASSPDSDDERLVIDEQTTSDDESPKKAPQKQHKCPHCDFSTKYQSTINGHILRHYGLRPMTCMYCERQVFKNGMKTHAETYHPGRPARFMRTKMPSGPPTMLDITNYRNRSQAIVSEPIVSEGPKVICLTCEKQVPENETNTHTHDKPAFFARKGEVVVKCCICLSLLPNVVGMQNHYTNCHPNNQINYAYFKLLHDTREIHQCGHCNKGFKFLRDLKAHHNLTHISLQLKHETKPYVPGAYDFESEVHESKTETPTIGVKRVAKKSTTKLPSQTVAKKSTTKLPFTVDSDSEADEYSYYGSKSTPLETFESVTTRMPFCNKMRTFTLKQLTELLDVNPVVRAKDCKK